MPFQSAKRMIRRCLAPARRWLCWLSGGSWKRALAGIALLAWFGFAPALAGFAFYLTPPDYRHSFILSERSSPLSD